MKIAIKTDTSLRTVSESLQEGFPNLKIEFFEKPHGLHESTSKASKLSLDQDFAAAGGKAHDEEVIITADMTVAQVESLFQDHFGIGAQIFRRAGRAWTMTTVTDDWTLEKQNEEGFQNI